MEINRPKTLSEHREHFAKFVSLLTGELGVQAVFGDDPGSSGGSKIVLPKLENLDSKRLDFLYALCLREAGFLSMSKRSVASIAGHATQGELSASFAIESGRVERALMRKFSGASEILDQHWKKEAADPELTKVAFGFEPSKANADQAFPTVAKWALMGKPNYGWDKLFNTAVWTECVAAVESEPMASLISSSRLRNWDGARELAGKLWNQWITSRGLDATPKLAPSPKVKALADAEKALREGIPAKLSSLTKARDEAIEKAKKATEKSNEILGSNKSRLDELNKMINALGKERAPFANVADKLSSAREWDEQAARERAEAASAQAHCDAVKAEAAERQRLAEEAAKGKGEKFGEKAEELRSKKEVLEESLAQAKANAATPSLEAQARMDELEAKIEKAREDLARKTSEFSEKAAAEQSKADAAEGDKKNKLEKRVQALLAKIADLQAKSAQSELAARQKSQEIASNSMRAAQEKQARIEDQIAELGEKLRNTMEESKSKQAKALEKGAPTSRMQNQDAKAQARKDVALSTAQACDSAAQEMRAKALTEASKSKKMGGMSEAEMMAKIEELEKKLAESAAEKAGIEAPASDARREASEARREARNAAENMSMQAFKEMQKLQNELDAQGIECDLVERMEEIDGWAEANAAQAAFDKQATDALGQPVINGSGGGVGRRNALEEIALRADGIAEINPNEIFAGIEKLSPLAGFSDSGVVDGSSGMAEKGDVASGEGFSSVRAHTVWRKDRDKVLNMPKKDASLLASLRKKFAAEIVQTKREFQARMKPSYKSKFRGGREEGQLDNRSIWKLAANMGDDFYEIDAKKPDNKASASIVVDISGSLASLGPDAAEKLQACALMISEGLSECNIEHEILGYCAPYEPDFGEQKISDVFNRKSCRLETVVAKNFGDKGLSGIASLALAQADNSDGESLRVAVSRLKKRAGKKKIVFLISDGKPFMQDSDIEVLDEDLRRALIEAANQKIAVVSIGFGANGHPVLGEAHIGVDKVSDLPSALGARLAREE